MDFYVLGALKGRNNNDKDSSSNNTRIISNLSAWSSLTHLAGLPRPEPWPAPTAQG